MLASGHPHEVAVTGLYGHTGSALPQMAQIQAELDGLRSLMRALVDAPQERMLRA